MRAGLTPEIILERGGGWGDSPQPCGAQIPPGLAAQRGPAEPGGVQLCQPQKPPGLEDEAVVTFGARHAGFGPRSTAAGHQLGLGHQDSSSFHMCSPKRIPKVRNLRGGRERGQQGRVASFPVQHLDSRAGEKPLELLSQLMNSQIPGNPSKPQTTAPQTDAAHGSWHGQG